MICPNRPVHSMTEADLHDTFAWVDTQLVKSGPNKGFVKISAAKLADRIIAEAARRGVSL